MTQEQGKTGAVRRYGVRSLDLKDCDPCLTTVVSASDYDAALSRAETAERENEALISEAARHLYRAEAAEKQRDELAAALTRQYDDLGTEMKRLLALMKAGDFPHIKTVWTHLNTMHNGLRPVLASIAKEQQT